MRRITLKTDVPITSNPDILAAQPGYTLDYRGELLALLNRFPDGITIAEMERIHRIHKALRDCAPGGNMILEDSDFDLLLSKLNGAKFKFYAEELLTFMHDIASAEYLTPGQAASWLADGAVAAAGMA